MMIWQKLRLIGFVFFEIFRKILDTIYFNYVSVDELERVNDNDTRVYFSISNFL